MKIYLVRHGESISNKEGYIAFYHTGLTKRGKQQSKRLGKYLTQSGIKFDAIYCSPLYRALQTLEEVLKTGLEINQKNIFITPLLAEINRKEFEGRPREEYYQAQKASGITFDDFRCKGGESEKDVKKRAAKFKKFLQQSSFKSVLVITHGHFIAQFTSLFNAKGPGHNQPAALCLLEIRDKRGQIIFWNNKRLRV